MAVLSSDDLEKLFSGAPQFFARSLGHCTGAPHPSVAFPFDEELRVRDLTDHVQIEDPAWGCVTAWPHITRGGCEHYDEDGLLQHPAPTESPKRPHFYPRCHERPNMLSIHGLEKGTMGYQAALELSVSDALQEEQFGFERLGFRPAAIIEARERLTDARHGNKDIGICQLQESEIIDRLIRCSNRCRAGGGAHRLLAKDLLYAELFPNFLKPPTRVLDRRDPQSLSVQIHYLLKVLAAPNVWIDFSQVAWRIRLGKILWGDVDEQEDDGGVREDTRAGPGGRREESVDERYWLLLQVLLGCELLVRLDSITDGEELGIESIKPSEILRFERDANTHVKWTLILSRCWLEKVNIVQETAPPPPQNPTSGPTTPSVGSSLPGSWLASVTAAIAGTDNGPADIAQLPTQTEKVSEAYSIRGRHHKRQANGLVHFARKLRWPGADALASQILKASHSAAERKPGQTPLASTVTSRTSYFGPPTSSTGSSTQQGSFLQRGRRLTTILSPSGWLSRSYISGLVLPGEGLGHFLMASLLESDPDAISSLGPMANLCGGFVYSDTSFWSTACIVGRVLAAGKGATECMGWVSSDVVPVGFDEGWIDVEVDGPEGEMSHTGTRARLWEKVRIEQESGILGNAGPDGVLPADFIVPFEGNYSTPPRMMAVELNSLRLTTADGLDDASSVPTPFSGTTAGTTKTDRPCLASMTFDVTSLGEVGVEHEFTLKKDVNFVTAHPCIPSHRVRLLKSPSSPTIHSIDVLENGVDGHSAHIAGHPLHKSYTHRVIHLSELLENHLTHSLQDLLDVDSTDGGSETGHQQPRAGVLVIDCITGFVQRPPSAGSASSSSSSSLSCHQFNSSRRSTSNSEDSMLNTMSPSSPVLRRGGFFAHNWPETAVERNRVPEAQDKMHLESRRRRFGSDMEVLVRALCAEKGWNAVISRRRRGCLACAIREAGALGWQVIIRVG